MGGAKRGGTRTTGAILAAMAAGVVLGLVLNRLGLAAWASWVEPLGDVFLRLLRMVIVPLVFSSVFISIVNLRDVRTLGDFGKWTFSYYVGTTAVAVLLGIVVVNVVRPGVGADLGGAGLGALPADTAQRISSGEGLLATIVGIVTDSVPTNVFQALAEGHVLQIILFSVVLGVSALHAPSLAGPVVSLGRSVEALSLVLVQAIMRVAPVGVFALVLDIMAKMGVDAIAPLLKYILAVLGGLLLHVLFLLSLGSLRARRSPVAVLRGVSSPLAMAASTCSTIATLPVTTVAVVENLKVRKNTAEFVLPLGATVNMDGTALYESVAAIFIAQAYGVELGFAQQVTIFVTATVAAVGAASIPGAGLITMGIVLSAVGLPLEGIGLILAVDRFLDMFRTMVNVLGDCVGTILVNSLAKEPMREP